MTLSGVHAPGARFVTPRTGSGFSHPPGRVRAGRATYGARVSAPTPGPARRHVLVGLAAAAAAGLAGCSGRDRPGPTAAPASSTAPVPASPAGSADDVDAGGSPSAPAPSQAPDDLVVVATAVVDELRVHPRPADLDDPDDPAGQVVDQVLDRRQEVSGQVVLLALATGRAWAHVQLPVRPNGSTGWVRLRDVGLSRHRFSIQVRLSDHELVVVRAGREVLRSAIGVGTQDTPTPGGDYYVKELLAPPDPTGVYGPYAYGLSGFSTVLSDFAGGDGVIGIHGTNAPELVGTDVSSGCIRLPNDVITALVEEVGLPLGTPVTILA